MDKKKPAGIDPSMSIPCRRFWGAITKTTSNDQSVLGDMADVMHVKVSSTEMPTTKCITRKGRALAPQMHLD